MDKVSWLPVSAAEESNTKEMSKETETIEINSHAPLSGVRSSFSGNETLKRIGWEAEKIFASYPKQSSRSKTRQDCRVLVAQAIVDELLVFVPKNRQKELIHSLGFFTEAECARIMGCSRQYVNKIQDVMQEKIFFAGKWWLKPIPLAKKNSL